MVTVCDKCGQTLEPGVIPCKVSALEVRPGGIVALILEARCSGCGEAIAVKLNLVGRLRVEEE